MASGSAASSGGRGGKGFDFASDDILCSYEDYGNQHQPDSSSDGADPSKDFHKSRISRSSVFPTASYGQPEESFNQVVLLTVERSIKKHTDNLMRFLEGISSRLSQLELYCYNLDKSIGEMRSDLVRDHGEADTKLKSVEKHLQEVHRSIQILRDKQELADTQKELAKLQLVQKESSSSSHSQSNEEKATLPATDPKKIDKTSEVPNQQLALALPHQVTPQQQQQPPPVHPPPVHPPSQVLTQTVAPQQSYYLPPATLPAPSAQSQHTQAQYLPSDPQYRAPQVQDVSRIPPQPIQMQVNQTSPGQQYPQYQQQWPQQVPQQLPQQVPQQLPQVPQQLPQQVTPPPQQSPMPPQIRPPSTTVYTAYLPPGQPQMPTPETLPNSMPMQVSYSAVPQPLSTRADVTPYGYGTGRPVPQQPPPQQIKSGFGAQPADGYTASGPSLPPASAYMIYDGEGGRHHHPPQHSHFPQGGYPPTNLSLQNPQSAAGTNMLTRNASPSPYLRNHPYSELVEKLVSMGFRGDHIISVIQRMEESGQPVDFNTVLDRLNVASGGSQRGWSG